MDLAITPHEGIGPVKLGMSREQVRAALGVPGTSFRRNQYSKSDTDVFSSLRLHVDYSTDDRCNMITAFADTKATLHGREIAGRPFGECRDWLEQLDPEVEVDDAGLVSRKLGVALYAPCASDDPREPVEAVHVFARGYYD